MPVLSAKHSHTLTLIKLIKSRLYFIQQKKKITLIFVREILKSSGLTLTNFMVHVDIWLMETDHVVYVFLLLGQRVYSLSPLLSMCFFVYHDDEPDQHSSLSAFLFIMMMNQNTQEIVGSVRIKFLICKMFLNL